MIVKLLTEHHLEFLSLKGGCRGSSESTLVKMSNCWKSHAAAQIYFYIFSQVVGVDSHMPTDIAQNIRTQRFGEFKHHQRKGVQHHHHHNPPMNQWQNGFQGKSSRT